MSLSKQLLMDLMAYADGELEGDAKKRIEAIIAKDEEARRIVAATSMLSEHVQEAEDERVLPRVADKIVDDVMKRVSTERMGMSLDDSNEPKVVRIRRAAITASVCAVFAAAAAFWLFFRPAITTPVATRPGASVLEATATRDPATNGDEGAELESADSPVSVFFVSAPSNDLNKQAVSSVVVWLGDTAANAGGGEP